MERNENAIYILNLMKVILLNPCKSSNENNFTDNIINTNIEYNSINNINRS